MTVSRRLRRALRDASSRLRDVVPARLRRRLRSLVAGRRSRPTLSVVMPVYNVQQYLEDCLESILQQDFRDVEVIAIDDGSTDGSPAILGRYAARDRRVRVFRQANSGQGIARNLGVAHARGEYLTFVDSDDLVPPGSFRSMVSTLKRSGSDFVVGGVRRLEDGDSYRPSWTVVVHDRDRIGVTIDEFPSAMADVVAHHRVLRRQFWIDQLHRFPAGVYEDHVPMVAAYLRAKRFDVLSRVTYDWRIRAEGTSTGQQKHALENLLARVAVKADAKDLVWREGSAAVQAAWIGRVLDIDFPPYIDHALRGGEQYRNALRDALATYVSLATPEALNHVRVQQKVRTFLASRGAWDDVEVAQAFFREYGSVPPTSVRDGRVILDGDLAERLDTTVSPQLLALSQGESRMQACALRARWVGEASLELTGWAVIRGVDLSSRQPTIQLALVSADGSRRIGLASERFELTEATRWVNWPHGAFERGGFRTVIDVAQLAAVPSVTDWRVRVRIAVDGIEREGSMHHAVAGSPASRASIGARRITTGGTVAAARFDSEHGLTIGLRPSGWMAERLDAAVSDGEFTGAVHGRDRRTALIAMHLTNRSTGFSINCPMDRRDDAAYEFRIGVARGDAVTTWDLRVVDANLQTHSLEWPVDDDHAALTSFGVGGVRWIRSPRGHVQLALGRSTVEVIGVQPEAEALIVDGIHAEPEGIDLGAIRLSDGDMEVEPQSVDVHEHRVRIRFPLRLEHADGSSRALRSGLWTLRLRRPGGALHDAIAAETFAQQLPIEAVVATHCVRVLLAGQSDLQIKLSAPLTVNEASAHGQRQLQDAYAADKGRPGPGVLFIPGVPTADSVLRTVHVGLRARSSHTRTWWAVPDLASAVPEGATALLVGSRDWYARLASVTRLCTDADFEAYVRRRSHQRVFRLFADAHEPIGRSMWVAAGWTPRRISDRVATLNELWSVVLAPAGSSTERFRHELGFEGPVLSGHANAIIDALLRDPG